MSNSPALGRACGKVILLGEHAVVHGSKALAMAVNRGVTVTSTRSKHPFSATIPAWDRVVHLDDNTSNSAALSSIASSLDIPLEGIQMRIDVEIPSRSGLGASASVATAIARSLLALSKKEHDAKDLFEAVQASERVFHGNPSGLDATVAIHGGVVLFSKSTGPRPQNVSPPPLFIVHSGQPGETRKTVARFAEKIQRAPKGSAARIKEIDHLVATGLRAVQEGDLRTLAKAMNQNHALLDWFGVSCDALNRIVDVARDAGAWGAKLTGGGGGGCALVLAPENQEKITRAITGAGFELVNA